MVTGFSIGITQNSQSVENNRSNVTVALTITWNGGSYNATGNAAGDLTIDGTAYSFKAVFNTAQKASGSEVIYSKTMDVDHDADGNKTLVCSATFASGTQVGTVTASATKSLTQIPRESTLSVTPADIGAVSAITVDRKNRDYTHSIAYEFGNLRGYISNEDGALSDAEVKLSAIGISFPIPETFYEQIPDAPSGDCVLTIRTYSGNTRIGQDQTCSFKVTAAEEQCRPEVGGTVVDVNPATLALTGDGRKMVRSMSTARCTVIARAKNSASVASRTIAGVAVTEEYREIAGMESPGVEFGVSDSRGYSASCTVPVELVEYIRLSANVTAKRTDPTSGNVKLEIGGRYFSGSFGAATNSLTVRYRIGSGEYVTVVPQIGDNEYTASAQLQGLDYQSAHSITVEIRDKLETLTRTVQVGKGIPVFDWGEEDFAFHVPVSAPSLNQVFMGTAYLGGTNKLVLQSKFTAFTDVGNGRQSVFLFGMDNGLLIQGVIGVNDAGVVLWSGTDGVSVAAGDGGTVVVNLPIEAWDWFTLLSAEEFSIV